MENMQDIAPTPAEPRETAETVAYFSLDVYMDGPSSAVPHTHKDCATVNRPTLPGLLAAAERLASVYPKARCSVWTIRIPADGDLKRSKPVGSPAYFDTLEELAELARKNSESLDALALRARAEAEKEAGR